ncbi:AMP-binding protein [Roseibium sediminicola]|uniref:AMP-binding protein n=1 Tax=Roseibium sediminicola TaxID=2933272 RepID=A0ABT0GTX0_9HYPH|nr:AMP-binding protein [Roseibium sp. CAU 1639]MCK7612872.1 AMP-binding protein [Roseibium sp. CAU 1639]
MDFLTDMAAKRAELTPEALAFADQETGRRFSFGEINDRASRLGNLLLGRGLSRGDRMAVLCLNHPDFFVLLFAAQKTGILLVPLNWRQPAAELTPILEVSGARLLFHDDGFAETARQLAAQTGVELLPFGAAQGQTSALDPLLAAASPAAIGCGRIKAHAPWYLLYTSGTTGLPKAVIQTAGMAYANMINYGQAAGLSTGEKGVNFLPLFHTAGINLPTLPIFLNGGSSTVLRKFDPDTVLGLIDAGEVTCFFGVPAIYQALSLSPGIGATRFDAVRSLGCGGAPVPKHLLTEFQGRGVTICNGMGMTETGPTVFLMDKANAAGKIGSVGKPQLMTDVRLIDTDGGIVEGPGEGELQFRGPNITPGYMDNPEATIATFTVDGWLKSGDIGRRDEDGYYYIVDRIKDMYISGGENVYPAEVEKVLVSHPAILEAVVIGVADEKWGEVGAAFVIARPGMEVDTAALPAWCRTHLAPYKIPKSFAVVDDMPRTAAGKVRKNILKDRFQSDKTPEDA